MDLSNESWSLGFTTGVQSRAACIHDVDGDGDADILLAQSSGGLALLLGDGAGSYSTGTAPTLTGTANDVVIADLDLDGDADAAAATASGLKAWAWSGSAWTVFGTGLPSSGNYSDLDLSDVDRDGDLDIVAAATAGSPTPYGVEVWLNARGGAWASGLGSLAVANSASAVSIADINRDGYPDIMAGFRTKGVAAYLGGAGPSWTSASSGLPTAGTLSSVSAIDANGDGLPDILGAYGTSNGMRIWVGNGGSSWTASFSLPSTGIYTAAEPGDFNRDGRADVFALRDGSGPEVWHGDGALAWTESSAGLPGAGARWVAVGDAGCDSWQDALLMPRSGVATLYGYAAWKTVNAWSASWQITTGTQAPNAVYLRDLDNDARLEIVVLPPTGGILIYDYSGGSWVSRTSPAATGNYRAADFGDFNRDGKVDIVATATGAKAWAGNGAWGWTASSSGLPTTGSTIEDVRFADVHNDGIPDIVTASRANAGGRVYKGNGAGTWTATFGLPATGNFYGIETLDLNKDGDSDVVFASDSGILAYAGDSADGWTAMSTGLPADAYDAVSSADLDADGDLDLAASSANPAPVDLVLTSPLESWVEAGTVFDTVTDIRLRESTMDGRPDAFAIREGAVLPLKGFGSSFLNMSTGIVYDMDASAFAVGDVNGDGRDDIAEAGLASVGNAVVHILLGRQVAPYAPTAPSLVSASLAGAADSTVAWSASPDEAAAGFEGYSVYWSDSYDDDGTGYTWVADTSKATHSFSHADGAPSSSQFSFYLVMARGAGCQRASSPEQGYLQRLVLNAGWTLASTPFDADSTPADLAAQDANLTRMQAYLPSEGGWRLWDRASPSFVNTLSELPEGAGLWIFSGANGTVLVQGTARPSFSFHLSQGWNLMACPYATGRALAAALAGLPWDLADGFSAASVYHLAPLSGASMALPGCGAWVHVTAEADWTGSR